jgi:hypothetical protein
MGLMIWILMKMKTNALSARMQQNYQTLAGGENGAPVVLVGGTAIPVTFYSKLKGSMGVKLSVIV